jgi:hypothetical protein
VLYQQRRQKRSRKGQSPSLPGSSCRRNLGCSGGSGGSNSSSTAAVAEEEAMETGLAMAAEAAAAA